MCAQQREILGGAHLDCDRTERIDDRGPQRHERQSRRELGLEEVFLALGSGHSLPDRFVLSEAKDLLDVEQILRPRRSLRTTG